MRLPYERSSQWTRRVKRSAPEAGPPLEQTVYDVTAGVGRRVLRATGQIVAERGAGLVQPEGAT